MKKVFKVIGIVLLSLIGAVVLLVGAAVLLHVLKKTPEIPATAENTTGLVQAIGRGLYDSDGNEVVLQGVNAGTTFITEGWLAPYATEEPVNGEYPTLSEAQFQKAFRSNPNLSDAQVDELLEIYYQNWFTKEDVKRIADLGMNCLRIPFYYTMFLNEDFSLKSEEAFAHIDRIADWCEEYGVYIVLDLHGAPGSQNGYEHSGAEEYDKTLDTIHFWYNDTYIQAACDLWAFVSEHYKDREIIAAYDILNEPRGASMFTDKDCYPAFDRIYDAIRATGDEHCVMMEGCWSFSTLPDPDKYGWENVIYSYHWYNWVNSWLPDLFFYAWQDASEIFHNYDVPVFIGEFTAFANESNWSQMLSLFEDRHYSWTLWTYKMSVYGWWDNSWGLYNLNYWEGDGYIAEKKVNVSTATYEEIKNAFELITTDHAKTSCTYQFVKDFFDTH